MKIKSDTVRRFARTALQVIFGLVVVFPALTVATQELFGQLLGTDHVAYGYVVRTMAVASVILLAITAFWLKLEQIFPQLQLIRRDPAAGTAVVEVGINPNGAVQEVNLKDADEGRLDNGFDAR